MTDDTDISSRHQNRCARTGCPNPVPRNPRGRPRLYCTPACRTAAHRHDHTDAHQPLHVEVDHGSTSSRGRPAGHVWLIRLRRGPRQVTIAVGLGRPSAEHLANQIRDVLNPPPLATPTQTR
ncbi:MAG: hypothetical protein M3302_01700 [Actinomycetota bacterium]|nr:hypothetical protein [Actinomycetota bacterium]